MRHLNIAANLRYRPVLPKSHYFHTYTRDIRKHQKAAGQRAISAKAEIRPESSNCCLSHSLKGTKTTLTQATSLSIPLPKWEKLTFTWPGPALAPTALGHPVQQKKWVREESLVPQLKDMARDWECCWSLGSLLSQHMSQSRWP